MSVSWVFYDWKTSMTEPKINSKLLYVLKKHFDYAIFEKGLRNSKCNKFHNCYSLLYVFVWNNKSRHYS